MRSQIPRPIPTRVVTAWVLASVFAWATLAAPAAPSATDSDARPERPEIRHSISWHWALSLDPARARDPEQDDAAGGSRYQSFELSWNPELDWQLGPGTRLHGSMRLRADAFDRLVPGRISGLEAASIHQPLELGDRTELELRELYLETQQGEIWWTLGKQQIVWGKADGLKVLDVVNPQDFREFILEDFESSRIPLWAVRAEVPIGPWALEAFWIPDRTYHRLPEAGALFEITSPRLVPSPPPGIPVDVEPARRPDGFFSDSDAGFRLSRFLAGWDLTFNYLYHYADTPVPERTLEHSEVGPKVIVSPTYQRTHLVGGTFANTFGDLTLRGEVGYTTDRYVNVTDLADPDGIERSGELAWVVGVDGYGFTDTVWSVQLFRNRLTDAPEGLPFESGETRLSGLLRRTFLNERLTAELLWLHDLDLDDGLARAEVRFDWTDTLRLEVGIDVFYGDPDGIFGQFDSRDRLVIGGSWSP